MELNGPANIDLIIKQMEQDIKDCGHVTHGNMKEYLKSLNENVDTLIRYMIAIKNQNPGLTIPMWHDVRDNKDKHPNHRGEFK